MSKCPECKKEIDHLHNIVTGWNTWNVTKDGQYEDEGFEGDGIINEYRCPECDATITSDEREALKFLNSETLLERESHNKKQNRFTFARRTT